MGVAGKLLLFATGLATIVADVAVLRGAGALGFTHRKNGSGPKKVLEASKNGTARKNASDEDKLVKNGTIAKTAAVAEKEVSLKNVTAHGKISENDKQSLPSSFTSYYETVKTGRGIWKWNDALVAYDRHLLQFQGKPVVGAEVGVQSGGSIVMWHKVLGEQSTIHGLDINPMCADFVDDKTSITIGDQGNVQMWDSFFAHVSATLDFLIDDGGHFPTQMLQTTYSVFPRLNAGGVLAIEDIHGAHYLESFFEPLATYLGPRAEVASLHLYPYLLIVQKIGSGTTLYDPTQQKDAKVSAHFSTLEDMRNGLKAATPGSLLVLENAQWGHFINPNGLTYFFQEFIDLYQPQSMPDNPKGCADTSVAVCTSGTVNSEMQNMVYGVHILPSKLVVEVPSSPPVVEAVRHGDKWIERPENHEIPQRLQKFLNDGKVAHHLLPGTKA